MKKNIKPVKTGLHSPRFSGALTLLGLAGLSANVFAASVTLDTTYNTTGTTENNVSLGSDVAWATIVDANGKTVTAGSGEYAVGGGNVVMERRLDTGALDTSFGGTGFPIYDFEAAPGIPQRNTRDGANALIQLGDGGYIVGGNTFDPNVSGSSNTATDFALLRVQDDGSSTSTKLNFRINSVNREDSLFALAPQTIAGTQYFVAAGSSYDPANVETNDFAIARYDAFLNLDGTFAGSGKTTVDFFGFNDTIRAAQVLPSGKIVVGGLAGREIDSGGGVMVKVNDWALAMFNEDGTLDTSFDTDGKVTLDFDGGNESIMALAIQNGKILAGGYAAGKFALARFNLDGSLDTTFGTGGKVSFYVEDGSDSINALVLTNGYILALGSSSHRSTGGADRDHTNFAIAVLNENGVLETSVGTGGKIVTDVSGTKHGDSIFGGALDSSGRLVVGGYTSQGDGQSDQNFATARYILDLAVPFGITVTGASIIEEDDGANATSITLTRSGDTSAELEVELRSSKPKEATVPATVTFAAGSDTVIVPVDAVNDALVDGTKTVVIEARAAGGYLDAQTTIQVTDKTVPALTLRLLPNTFYEDAASGPRLQVTHNLEDTSAALPLTLGSTDGRLTPPAGTTEIPAGTRTGTFQFTLTPDSAVQGTVVASVSAAANGFTTATTPVTINERLLPLSLTLAPGKKATFSEDAGAAATTLRLTRTGDLTAELTLEARTSTPKEATVPATVTIPAGQSYVDIPVNAVNDTLVDGTKNVVVEVRTDGVYADATYTVRVGNVTKPQFTALLKPVAFYEDDATGPLLVVTHNLEDTSAAVPLTVTSSDTRLSAPVNPQIPAGTRSANIRLVLAPDAGVQGSLPVTVTVDDNAFATNFPSATANGTIYDRQAALTLTATPSLISESNAGGRPNITSIRITRNGSLKAPLEVTLSARTGADQVTFTSPVTIPAGQAYADVTVTAVADAADGSKQVTLAAQSAGYKTATVSFIVVD